MASLVETLTASGGPQSAGFLNDIILQLWPHINAAGSKIAKEALEPVFASMLPGPLSSLHFTKLDLGDVPIRFSKVEVTKTENDGIKLDMDLDWEGDCDIDLDGQMVPKLGVEKIRLQGRLSILLCPLTNIIPLIGAAQVAFINRPKLELNFTGAADVADSFMVDKLVRKTILDVIASMAVLPNRYLVKLDAANDFFKTYQHPLGVVRFTVERATGIPEPKKRAGVMGLLDKITKDVPDCYCKVNIGAEEWATSVKQDSYDPEWDETHDFLISDIEQVITLEVEDKDLASHDDIGIASITVQQLLLAGGAQELALAHRGEATSVSVRVCAQLYNFVEEAAPPPAGEAAGHEGQVYGLATVLVAGALGLSGQRDELNPSVKLSWAGSEFRTAAVSYSPGVDIYNPSFDTAFNIPLTSAILADPAEKFRLALMQREEEAGVAEIMLSDVLGAPGMAVEGNFDVGTGAAVRARIYVHGLQLAQ